MNRHLRRTSFALCVAGLAACSGGGGTSGGSQTASSPPPPPDNPPTLSVESALEVDEGRLFTAEIVTTDPEGAAVSVSLSGDDSSFFRLESGFLVANEAFDFDAPQDADGDSIYQLSLEASDGVQSVVQDFGVRVLDIPRDGLVRILHVQNLVSAGDLTGDGLDELLVRPIRVPGGPLYIAGIVLPRAATLAESPAVFDATAPVGSAGVIEERVMFHTDFPVGPAFNSPLVSGTYMSATGPRKYAGMVTTTLTSDAWNPVDTTLLFPDTFDFRNASADINLSTNVLPAGLRTTRDQGARVLGAFIPVGDLNGDGYSDVIQTWRDREPAPADSAEHLTLVSGKTIRDGSYDDLFVAVTDLAAQAVTLLYGRDDYNADDFAVHQWPYREPGTADVDRDGFDDLVQVTGLRGATPYDPLLDTVPEGHEISIFSGRRLMDRLNGEFAAESFTAPDVFRIITTSDIGTPIVAGIGDVNSDGFADILVRMLNGGFGNDHDRFEAYLVSGAALTSAPEGTITIGLETVPGVSSLNTSTSTSIADDAFMAANVIGGDGDDIILSLHHLSLSDETVTATAVVLSDQLFTGGFPARIDLSNGPYTPPDEALAALPSGSFVRIDSPPFQASATDDSGQRTYYGYSAFSAWGSNTATGGASISDIDGDDRQELALVYFTDDQKYLPDPTKLDSTIRTTDLFLLNSRVLESARLAGESINLGASFD